MRIGIISDTHITSRARQLPALWPRPLPGWTVSSMPGISTTIRCCGLNAIALPSLWRETPTRREWWSSGFELLTLASTESASPMATWARAKPPGQGV